MICGIYEIKCVKNGKRYIGSSKDIQKRHSRHKSDLKHNRHSNKYLQHDFNVFGEKFFSFNILEYCCEDSLIQRESYYIDKYRCLNNQFGYNIIDPIIGFDVHKQSTPITENDIEVIRLLFGIGCSVNRISELLQVNYYIVKSFQTTFQNQTVSFSDSIEQLKKIGFDLKLIFNENVWSQISAIPLSLFLQVYNLDYQFNIGQVKTYSIKNEKVKRKKQRRKYNHVFNNIKNPYR